MSIPLTNFEACQAETIGVSTATSLGTAWTTSGTTNTKTAYTQLSAATANDWGMVHVTVKYLAPQGSTYRSIAIDIAIGAAGSEIDVIPNLIFTWSNLAVGYQQIALPITIPAGSRIAFRYAFNSTGDLFEISITGFTTNFHHVAAYDALGFNATNSSGTILTDASSSNTKSAWTQIISSTTKDYVGFFYAFDTYNQNDSSAWLFDIGFGAAAAEVVVIPNISARLGSTINGIGLAYVPIRIPSGTRLSSRLQTSNYVNNFERPDLTIYGAIG